MASKKIKGITIEIDGNTTKLGESLKSVEKVINNTNSELKDLNKALKLDPKNTELLSQKQEVLKKNIQESTNKLNQLKEAQRQMGNYNSLTEEQKENYRALSVEISKSETAIKNMNVELRKTNTIDLSKVGATLKNVGEIAGEVIKKVGQVVAGVSNAMAGVVAAGVKSYADLEQNVGGVETLFGDDAQKVIDNANKAFETAGISANDYMAGVTSFSASLLQSLGNDTSKAAEVADMAFLDMSDNANKFGTDMSSIQNAYQGFAKQNYTMLDNLKLGYGGTKTEMERLLADAEKFSGVHYDINNLSDVYSAIHVIQKEMKVTGTTAKEASTTISGSANAMKASFDNFLNGSGSPEQLSETITTFITNIINTITELAPNILSGITVLIETLLPQLGTLLTNLLPQLFSTIQNMLDSLFNMISKNVQPIADMVVYLLTSLVDFILQNLPMIIEVGLELIIALATGVADSLPELIPTITEVILDIVNILLDNIDLIIEAAIQIMVALTQGIMNALPNLLARLPEIIIKICSTLFNLLPQILSAGIRIVAEIGFGLIKGIPDLISKIPEIITSIVDALGQGLSDIFNVGKNLVQGLWNGINDAKKWVLDKIKGFGKGILDGIKDFFGIHSPSKLMQDQIGKNLGLGIGEGFEDSIPQTLKEVDRAMSELNNGIQASVNPVINPTANSNPLILNIENFNNSRDTDIQQLAEEIEFYRKNSALAKGDA